MNAFENIILYSSYVILCLDISKMRHNVVEFHRLTVNQKYHVEVKNVEFLSALFDPSTVMLLGLIFLLIVIAIGITLDEFKA